MNFIIHFSELKQQIGIIFRIPKSQSKDDKLLSCNDIGKILNPLNDNDGGETKQTNPFTLLQGVLDTCEV